MQTTIALVRTLLSAQILVTAFLAVLLWSLHKRLSRQEFNRWWATAWTLTTLFLFMGQRALGLPGPWTATKVTVVLVATILGFLVAPALVFGAVSFRSPGVVTRRWAVAGLAAAALLAIGAFAVSRLWVSGLAGFSVRNGTRTLLLFGALVFSAWVFLRHFRVTKSRAALVTGVSCLGYGINQAVYAAAQLAFVVGAVGGATSGALTASRPALLSSARLLYADVILTCGICLGMVLLLVEAYQRSERALSERAEIERKLRASEDRYRDLVEHSEDLLCIHDLEGRILSVNPAPARILGYTVEEVLTMKAQDVLSPDVRDGFAAYVQALQRDGVVQGILKVVTRTGERRLWQFRNTLRSDGLSAPLVRGMARDVTEQFRAERALRRSEEKFAVAFRASPCAMAIVCTGDGHFVDVNATFESLTGRDREELLSGTSAFEHGMWVDPSDVARLRQLLAGRATLAGREMPVRHQNGSVATVTFSAEVVHVAGKPCVLLAGLDVTEQKRAERRARELQDELAHAGRVMTLGTLTGSLAHEIKQPLTAISSNTYAALTLLDRVDRVDASPEIAAIRGALRDVMNDNSRIDDVIHRMRGMLRKERREHSSVDVNAIVDDVLRLVRSDFIGRRIALDVSLGANIPSVVADRVQLQQVVLNILMNAAEAVSAAGAAGAGGTGDERRVSVSTAALGSTVSVSVADHGVGASAEDFNRLFEPFFTTKRGGMGLGLSICRAILDAHGGRIMVRRNAERGLTCWFELNA